jgi:hypothetical protein
MGDTREEAEHIRAAIEKISDKAIKVIIYSHSHYALGAGALVDDQDDVLIIGHPQLNETVEFVFRDRGDLAVALHVHRGVAEYVPVPADYYRQPDLVLELDAEAWAALYLSAIELPQAVNEGMVELEKGEVDEVAAVFDLFDRFVPARNYKIPPLED